MNKKVEEDKRGRNFGKIVNSRDEDIPKERYGLAMKTISDHYKNKKENLKIEQIEQIIERFMDKNREYMDKFMRAQEQMWKEMDARISNIERKVGIHDLRTRTYEERSEEEGGQDTQYRRRARTNQERKHHDRNRDRSVEEWENDHDYDY